MNDETIFINYINDNYSGVTNTLRILCGQRQQMFDEDTFHESILRCHKAINKKGYLADKSSYGITSYLIRSYFNLVNEQKRAACNAKRDMNYDSDNITNLYEDWYNDHNLDAREKIVGDMFKDFATLYLLKQVEDNFDTEHFYLFRLKVFDKTMTYRKLSEKTGIKGCRQKVVDCKNWLKQNVKQEDIRKEFDNIYGEIL